MPTEREEVVNVAFADPFSVTPEARVVAPSVKVAVPVGVPEYVEVTVAVNVTTCPKTDGFTVDERVVVVGSVVTTCGDEESVPLPAEKWVSPA